MTLEIDCTTRTKQKSTLSVESLYQTRVWMLGPTLDCQQHSMHRYSYLEEQQQQQHVRCTGRPSKTYLPTCVWTHHGHAFTMYVGSYNNQSALRQYSVLLSAPFLVTVVYRNGIWAVSKDCSDCGTKANSSNNAKA